MRQTIKTTMFVAIVSIAAMSCQSGTDPGPLPGEDEVATDIGGDTNFARVSPETRLLTAMDRIQFAFRVDGSSFKTRHVTHDVDVAQGVVRITPHHRTATAMVAGLPLHLETRDIRRGNETIAVGHRASRVDPETGHLLIDRGDALREEIENFEGGIEQSWHFANEPAGSGDLVVRVAVAGHPYVGSTERGLHFITANKLGFNYGHATWIDADGSPTRVASRYADGHIEITVPAELVASSDYPAVLDPTVNPEIAVDDPVNGWTGATARRSSIASSGSGFLVVWSDSRNGADTDIYATRLSAAGAVQDNLGIVIAEGTATLDNPAVGFAGGNYVVAWDDGTNVFGAHVTTGGAVTSLGSVGAGTDPDAASRSGDALVVFQSGGGVRGSVFNGTTLGASFQIAASGAAPAVGSSSGEYLVAWSEGAMQPNLRGQFVTASGTLSGAAFDISAGGGNQDQPAVGNDGTNFFVVWQNNNAGTDIYGTRVTPGGAILDTHMEGMLVVGGAVVSANAGIQSQPDVGCGSGACLAAWSDRIDFATNQDDLYAQRLDSSTFLVGANFAIAATTDMNRTPSIVATSGGYRVSWDDRRHHGPDAVFTALVGIDGSLPEGSGANIVRGNNQQTRPALRSAFGVATSWLVVWSDSRVLGSDIMGVRFASGGLKVDNNALTFNGSTGQQTNPTLAFDGANFIAAWNDSRTDQTTDIFAARMTPQGNVLDPGGIAVSTAANDQLSPAIATGGGVSLVVWQDRRTNFDIFGALIDGAGNVTVSDIQICLAPDEQLGPSVAYSPDDNVFLVTWQSGNPRDVFGALVSTTGTVSVPCGAPISNASGGQTGSRVAYGAGAFFVTWSDTRTDTAGDIVGARVTATGGIMTVVDTTGIQISDSVGGQSEPDVAFVSPNLYAVAWTDSRNSGVSGNDIWGQSVLTTGVLDGPNFIISDNLEHERRAAITTKPTGVNAMVAYERDRPDIDTTRVGTRRLTYTGSTGTSCSMDSQCVSGFCVDKRCCDQACGGNDLTDCQACSVQRGSSTNGLCEVIANTNHVCRGYADTYCDVREKCDGIDPLCPPDLGRREGNVCTTSSGGSGTCPPNDVTGSPHVCQ